MHQSTYGALVGEYAVVASESLGPGTGSKFGSSSASVQQQTSKLGNSLPGKHISLRFFNL